MLVTKRRVWLWTQTAVFIVLLSALLSFATRPLSLPTIPEEAEEFVGPAAAVTTNSGAATGQGTKTGPVDRGLYPPKSQSTAYRYSTIQFRKMRRIPATGLVRGQNGKLIPYRLRPLFYPLPEATGDANQGSILTRLMKAKFTRPTAIPSTKRGMARLLDRIHQDASFVGKMESDPSATGKRYQAVHIQDRSDAAKSLEEMMKAKQPFYVHGANGKVWYFDTKDGNRYSYTDKLDPSDQELVKNFFTTAATTRENPGSSSYGTTEQSGSRFFASPAPARHVIGIESSHAPSWLRKLAETAKSLFRRPSDTTRSMHIV